MKLQKDSHSEYFFGEIAVFISKAYRNFHSEKFIWFLTNEIKALLAERQLKSSKWFIEYITKTLFFEQTSMSPVKIIIFLIRTIVAIITVLFFLQIVIIVVMLYFHM